MSADLQEVQPDQSSALQDAKQSEKAEVQAYFESTGFERWNRIYSDSDEVNKVQRNIRIGHQKTVDQVLLWLQEQGNLAGRSFCDAGCGVGSLSLPLAQLGAGSVAASDLSAAMVAEAARRADEAGNCLDQRRLARARFARKPEDLVAFDIEANVVDRTYFARDTEVRAAEMSLQVLDAQDRLAAHCAPPPIRARRLRGSMYSFIDTERR
jgi:SAM-dependent methyltransferase